VARTRVLIVDDSAFMRRTLSRLLGAIPSLEVAGAACNGEEGLRLARELKPDVITLDVEMPVLDGLGMLKRLMVEAPTRVVMLSSRTTQNARLSLDSLDCGAIDFVPKPTGPQALDIARVGDELVRKIEAAASMPAAAFLRHRLIALRNLAGGATSKEAVPTPVAPPEDAASVGQSVLRCGAPARRSHRSASPRVAARRLVVVASSTGGPSALSVLVRGLPQNLGAAVALVQHMPAGFTTSLAARLDSAGPLRCSEASPDDILVEDQILLAPGDHHMISSTSGHIQLVRLHPVNGVRPAADVTLQSVAPIWRERLLCVVLTGMGVDARDGARAVKQYGGTVLAQDGATATIFGMPKAVAEAGLADRVLPLDRMAGAVAAWCGTGDEVPLKPDRSSTAHLGSARGHSALAS
jgi:two-component system chemotaxis response regulator CheB